MKQQTEGMEKKKGINNMAGGENAVHEIYTSTANSQPSRCEAGDILLYLEGIPVVDKGSKLIPAAAPTATFRANMGK
jgi:hypothetical protein